MPTTQPEIQSRVHLVGTELRTAAKSDGGKRKLEGYAAIFDKRSEVIWPWGFREVLMPGCFKRVLKSKPDVRFLLNHNPDNVYARTAAGTLKLREDEKGLYCEAELADTQAANDLYENVRTGNITQMSFAFVPARGATRMVYDPETDEVTRFVSEVGELYDVCAATYPAYEETDLTSRSKAIVERSADIENLMRIFANPDLDLDQDMRTSIERTAEFLRTKLGTKEESPEGAEDDVSDFDELSLFMDSPEFVS